MSLFTIHIHADGKDFDVVLDTLKKIDIKLNNIGGKMATQADIDAVVTQLQKASAEILAKIAELQAQNPTLDLSALTTAAQALDDIVPDAPAV